MDDQHLGPPGRRRMLAGGIAAGAGLAITGGLVVRNQIRHPHRAKPLAPAASLRRIVLAVPDASADPVFLAARDQGIFEGYNLAIDFVPGIAGGRDALARLQSGRADAAVAPALCWLPRLQRDPAQGGLDARLVCGLQYRSARLLVARRAPFRRIEDLYRHAIGVVDPAGPERLFFSIVMRRKGMDPARDVEWRTVPASGLGLALSEGHVQAIAGDDPSIWQLRDTLHFDELASSMSGSYGSRINRAVGLRNTLLRQDPEAALALTSAIEAASVWAAQHPKEVSVLLAAASPDLTVQQATRMVASEGASVHPVGINLRNQIAQYIDEMKLLGITEEAIDSAALAKRMTANVTKG